MPCSSHRLQKLLYAASKGKHDDQILQERFCCFWRAVNMPPFMRKRNVSEKGHIVLEKVVCSGGMYIISHITNLGPRETPPKSLIF